MCFCFKDLNMLSAEEKDKLEDLLAKNFWLYEYTRHTLTAIGFYKPRYFSLSGGFKDIVDNFEVGKSYPVAGS